MQLISSPINPKDTGKEVNNLQTALLLFLDKQIIATFQLPDHPTEKEIIELREVLKNEIDACEFGDATQRLVLYFQLQQGLSDQYNGAIEEITTAKMNEILKALGAFDDAENKFIVKGFIRNADGTGFANAIVKAFDRDLRRFDPLGETTTGKDGYYEITYSQQQSSHAEKGNADLQVLVYETINDDEKKPLLTSDIFFNAPLVQEIDLTLSPSPATKEKSEWEKINEQVLPLLKEQKEVKQALNVFEDLLPEELLEDDLHFIIKETGLGKNNIQLWSLAYLRNKEVNIIEAVIFYGWFRMGLPTELKDLWAKTNDELCNILKEAINKQIIPDFKNELEKIITSAESSRLDFHLLPAKEGDKPSIGDVLNTLPVKLDGSKRLVVAKILSASSGNEPLQDQLKKNGFADHEIFGVQRTLGLQNITQNHLPLIKALQTDKPDATAASLLDLVKLEAKDWKALVEKSGVPETIIGDDAELNKQLYADQLAHTMEQLLPSAWITYRVDQFSSDPALKTEITSFFEQNPDFQIGKTLALNYFKNSKKEISENVKSEILKIERIVSCTPRLELAGKVIQKGFHSSFAIMQRSKDSFVSEMMDDSPGVESQLASTYAAAQERHAKATVLVTEYIRAKKDSPIAILKHKPAPPPAAGVGSVSSAATAANDLTADLATLFGNLDFCDCEHCSSVYSPAAYMVDLLQMLHSGKQPNNPSPLDVLLARRPDIAEIDLTCDNTNTSVPYIDLALEVLEKQVELFDENLNTSTNFSFSLYNTNNNEEINFKSDLDRGQAPARLISELTSKSILSLQSSWNVTQGISDNWARRWILRSPGWKINIKAENDDHGSADSIIFASSWSQTSDSSIELSAIPHFFNPTPYSEQLQNSFFPWTLPFDLWREETNAWLKQLGIDRNMIMNSFSNAERFSNADIANEFLGFSYAEINKLTNTTDGWKAWGFEEPTVPLVKDPIAGEELSFTTPNNNWVNVLNEHASILRHRAKLSQRELMNLLEIRFIQEVKESPAIKIELIGDECDVSKMKFNGLGSVALKRIFIFVKLWRKLGWSMFDLDRAINAFSQVTTSDNSFKSEFLVFIANIERLRQQSGLSIGIILNWYSQNLDTYSYSDFSNGKVKVLLSPYESLFYDRSVSRPRDAAFELATNRTELLSSQPQTVRNKLSHVAAALSVKQTEIEQLLPNSIDSILLNDITQVMDGSPVDCGGQANPIFELDMRSISGNTPSFIFELQHADAGSVNFSAIQLSDLDPGYQPLLITKLESPQVLRFIYKGTKPLLRIAITSAQGTLGFCGRISFDQLSIGQLSKLTRYTYLSKSLSLTVKELLLAINLTGINPFVSPESTLDLKDKLQLIKSTGFSLYDLDYLFRHQSLEQTRIPLSLEKATNVLTEIRKGLQKIAEETVQQIDERGEITKKWLSSLQWDSKLIDELTGPSYLGRGRIESNYFANHLPPGIALPASIRYDRIRQKLYIIIQPHPGASSTPAGDDLRVVLQQMSATHVDDLQLRAAINDLITQVQIITNPETNYEGTFPAGIVVPSSISYNAVSHKLSITLHPHTISDLDGLLGHLASPADNNLITAITNLKTQVENIKDPETNYIGHNFPPGIITTNSNGVISVSDGVAYEAKSRKIYITNILTESELLIVKNSTTDVEFKTAIDTLIEQLIPAKTIALGIRNRMLNFNQPEYTTSFTVSPGQAFTTPSIWSGRFFYRADNFTLVFVGLMKEDEMLALKKLDSANASYTAAIRSLFDLSNPTVPDPDLLPEFVNLSFSEKLIFEIQTPQERYAEILSKLLPFIRKQLNFKLLVEKLLTAFAWDPSLTSRLLKQVKLPSATTPELVSQIFLEAGFATSDTKVIINPAGFDKQFKALELIYKTGVIATRLDVKPNQIDWLYDSTWLNLPDLNQLPLSSTTNANFQQWVNLVLLMQLRDKWPGGEVSFQRLCDILQHKPGLTGDNLLNEIAASLKWPRSDFKLLVGSTGLNFSTVSIDNFRNPAKLTQLVECLNLIIRMGATSEMVIAWKQPSPTAQAALQARQLVRSRYDQSTWYELAQPIQNNLRQLRRSALFDYLIAKEGVRDANDLYGRYLIDPEMGPCMMTTRILQATSSIQLFINRCLMGLEPKVPASSIHKERWQWMKNYRVWEANRKVFFYPENWIEPELRDDKSPFFKELESELLQGDITSEKAEKALSNYLNKLDEVARLEVMGMYRETSYDLNNDVKYGFETLHVFARTYSEPRTYYYRKYIKLGFAPTNGYWTAWEKVDLDIEEGNYLYPVVWKQKLYLFWLSFIEKADEKIPQPNAPTLPDKYWHLSLSWSGYEKGKWQASKKYLLNKITEVDLKGKKNNFSLVGGVINDLILFEVLKNFDVPVPFGNIAIESKNLNKIKFEGYGIEVENYHVNDISNTPSFNEFKLCPQILFEISGVYIYMERIYYLFNQPTSPIILNYPHQDLRRKFEFRAPVIRDDSRNSLNNQTYSQPLSFIITDTFKRSFFGYPYWQEKLSLFMDWQTKSFQIIEVPGIYFSTFFHPQTTTFQETLRKKSVEGLLHLLNQSDANGLGAFASLSPNNSLVPAFQNQDVDFTPSGAYSQYNWELFFHLPFIVATHLAKNQRFEEARQWFHYIFDPTDNTSGGSEPSRFWHFRPFNEISKTTSIQQLANILADSSNTSEEKKNFDLQVEMWLANPFKPHAVARWRNRAYMFSVVMKYLDNLIAWGDQLFRRDTRESLNEATQIYILAAQILGRKPESVPSRTQPKTQSFSDIKDKLDKLSNAQVAAENVITGGNPGETNSNQTIFTLLFCIPDNPKILEYYDKVADRLFKLRNCMNIDGVVRQLALFDPPIDPAILVKAAAAGVDLSAALSDMNAPLPLYRFNVMSQKATELCGEVKSMGSALLSALEKRDGEAMSLLRSTHEIELLKQQRQIKELQVEEAKANIEALTTSYQSAQTKFMYYLRLVSMVETLTVPSGQAGQQAINLINAALDTVGKTVVVLGAVASVVNPAALAGALLMNEALTKATEALSTFLPAQSGDTNMIAMIPAEKKHLDELKLSHDLQQKAKDYQSVAQMMAMIPDITLGIQGVASSPVIQAQIGGTLLSKIAQLQGAAIEYESSEHAHRANMHSILAGYQRRSEDWLHQATMANNEADQILKQSVAATLRLTIADTDLRNHDKQIENAKTTDDYMRSKFTNEELYEWMVGQLSETYFQSYQLAYDVAKRAEKAYRFELGLQDNESNFIQFGYWDSLKKGLLAGENLYHDIKRMEVGYLEKNKREYELTKHVSLIMLDPLALMRLRVTGICDFEIPEVLYDIDHPGHYFRRIKSVSISIPCIAGPYTSISARLSLVNNRYRKNTNAVNSIYAEDSGNDGRFIYNIGSIQSIAASNAQNDSGVFELNFKDERYLPFEGTGAISNWQLELPSQVKQFDYNTISDVIIHVKYTAREGGSSLKALANGSIAAQLNNINQQLNETGLHIPISLKHDMPNEWNLLLKNQATSIAFEKSRLPYMVQGYSNLKIDSITFLARLKSISVANFGINITPTGSSTIPAPININCTLSKYENGNYYKGTISINGAIPFHFDLSGIGQSILDDLDELVLVVKYVLPQ